MRLSAFAAFAAAILMRGHAARAADNDPTMPTYHADAFAGDGRVFAFGLGR